MVKRTKELHKRRIYSEELRKSIVRDFEEGKFTVRELSKLYGIASQTIYLWIYKYSTFNAKGLQIIEMESSSTEKLKELHERIKVLERIVGQKQLNIDYLEKMIELAKQEYDIDIKKNFDTSQSTRSAKTDKQ